MATSIIPKSELRRNSNIIVGYAELPYVIGHDRPDGWGIPGGEIITDYKAALAYAARLDASIRSNLVDLKQLTELLS